MHLQTGRSGLARSVIDARGRAGPTMAGASRRAATNWSASGGPGWPQRWGAAGAGRGCVPRRPKGGSEHRGRKARHGRGQQAAASGRTVAGMARAFAVGVVIAAAGAIRRYRCGVLARIGGPYHVCHMASGRVEAVHHARWCAMRRISDQDQPCQPRHDPKVRRAGERWRVPFMLAAYPV